MDPRLLVSALAMAAFGVGLGSIPGVNENMRWYLGGFIPASGALVGLGTAWLAFSLAYVLRARITLFARVFLSVCALLAYVGTYYGNYLTTSVELKNVENVPDGVYKVRQLVSFPRYAKIQLEELSIEGSHGGSGIHLEKTGTVVMVAGDFLFCLLAALAAFIYIERMYPYCGRCVRYKEGKAKREIYLASDEANLKGVEESIKSKSQSTEYGSFLGFLNDLETAQAPMVEAEKTGPAPKVAWYKLDAKAKPPRFMLEVRERLCPTCQEATLWGRMMKKNHKNQWQDANKGRFRVDSQPYQAGLGLESQRAFTAPKV